MTNTTDSKSDEVILEVTQEEYDAAIAKGWNDDDIHKPGKYRYRRVPPERVYRASDAKVKVQLWIALDVLQHFENRAEKQNAASYQEQMSAELCASMERDRQAEHKAIEKLLSDEKFIAAVAEKVAAQSSEFKAA
ncbi:MAG: hypothetical protein ABI954_03310 [Pyrinomonadaceae bacterium]